MATRKIISFPENLTGFRVEASRAGATVMNVNTPRLNHRRWCCIAIHGSPVAEWLRVVGVENLFVEENLSRMLIDRDGKIIMTCLGGGGHPNLVAQDDRPGPAPIMNLGFPLDAIGL